MKFLNPKTDDDIRSLQIVANWDANVILQKLVGIVKDPDAITALRADLMKKGLLPKD